MNKSSGGFTLIEVLVYLGLYAIFFTGAVSGMYTLEESSAHNQTAAMIDEEGNFFLAKIRNTLGSATSLNAPTNSGSRLDLTNAHNETIQIFEAHGAVYIEAGSGEPVALSNSSEHVANLVFTSTDPATSSGYISVAFTIIATSTDGHVLGREFSGIFLLNQAL